jgi:hypothetical protein
LFPAGTASSLTAAGGFGPADGAPSSLFAVGNNSHVAVASPFLLLLLVNDTNVQLLLLLTGIAAVEKEPVVVLDQPLQAGRQRQRSQTAVAAFVLAAAAAVLAAVKGEQLDAGELEREGKALRTDQLHACKREEKIGDGIVKILSAGYTTAQYYDLDDNWSDVQNRKKQGINLNINIKLKIK